MLKDGELHTYDFAPGLIEAFLHKASGAPFFTFFYLPQAVGLDTRRWYKESLPHFKHPSLSHFFILAELINRFNDYIDIDYFRNHDATGFADKQIELIKLAYTEDPTGELTQTMMSYMSQTMTIESTMRFKLNPNLGDVMEYVEILNAVAFSHTLNALSYKSDLSTVGLNLSYDETIRAHAVFLNPSQEPENRVLHGLNCLFVACQFIDDCADRESDRRIMAPSLANVIPDSIRRVDADIILSNYRDNYLKAARMNGISQRSIDLITRGYSLLKKMPPWLVPTMGSRSNVE